MTAVRSDAKDPGRTGNLMPLDSGGEKHMPTCLRLWFCDMVEVWSNIKPGRCSRGPSFRTTSQGERMASMLGPNVMEEERQRWFSS